LRSGSKLALICGTVAALLSSLGPIASNSVATAPAPSQADQLRAERAQLVGQLQALTGTRADTKAQLLGAEQEFSDVSNRLETARQELAKINQGMQVLSRQIADDEAVLTKARAQLGTLVRATYEATSKDGFAAAIFSANNFNDAFQRIRGAQHVTDQVARLQSVVLDRESGLIRERTLLQHDGVRATGLESQLSTDSNRLVVVIAQRDQAFQAVDGPARQLEQRIADIDAQLAPPVTASAPCGNHFAYGYCTYYVATRRCVPWLGNAWEWWRAAAAMGFPEGQVPRRGAIAVWGQMGSSPEGHVVFVEAVGPEGGVPAGYFLVSEMNYGGWNRVNYRQIPNNSPGLLGFIY
jgi:hypothetical protein